MVGKYFYLLFCFSCFTFFGQSGLLDKLSVRLDLRTLFTCFLTLSHDALALYLRSLTLSRCSRYLLALSYDALVISLSLSHDALALSLRNSRLTRRGRITIGNHSPPPDNSSRNPILRCSPSSLDESRQTLQFVEK